VLDLNGALVGQKGESCRVFSFLAYSLTGFVLADTLLADTDDNKEEDINDKEEEDTDDKEEDVSDKEEDVDNNKKGSEYAINNMLPKLKPAAATPPKNDRQKRAWSGETCHLRLQEAEDQHTGVQALLNEDA
jgi:hypothetical protein